MASWPSFWGSDECPEGVRGPPAWLRVCVVCVSIMSWLQFFYEAKHVHLIVAKFTVSNGEL